MNSFSFGLTQIMPILQITSDEVDEFNLLQLGALDLNDKWFRRLYPLFENEMPHGTAKARDGDPYMWISCRLNQVKIEVIDHV